jgi:hypothetical protein
MSLGICPCGAVAVRRLVDREHCTSCGRSFRLPESVAPSNAEEAWSQGCADLKDQGCDLDAIVDCAKGGEFTLRVVTYPAPTQLDLFSFTDEEGR